MCTQTPAARSIKPPWHEVGCLPRASRSMYFLGCTHRRPHLLRTLSGCFQAYPFPSLPTLTGTELEMPTVVDGLLITLFFNGLSLSDQEDREAGLTVCKRKDYIFLVQKICLCVFCCPMYWSGCWQGLSRRDAWRSQKYGNYIFPAPSIFEALVTSCPIAWSCNHLRAVWVFRLLLLRQLWRQRYRIRFSLCRS